MEQNEIIVLNTQCGDWEGLFINGVLISEGHTLGEGNQKKFWLKVFKQYNVDDITEKYLCDEDDEFLNDVGSFPQTIKELKGEY